MEPTAAVQRSNHQYPTLLVVSNKTTFCNNQEYRTLIFVVTRWSIIPFGKGTGTAVPYTYDGAQMQHHTFDAT
jgi:hypothetical protein